MFIVLSIYYVLSVHMNPLQLVLAGTTIEATYLLFGLPTGILADMYSRRLSIIVGWFIVGWCLLAQALIPTFGAILAAQAVLGVGEACIDGATSAWLADEVGEQEVGPILVRSSQVSQIAGVIGTVAGVALGTIHLNLPIAAGAAAMIAVALFFAIAMPENGFRPARREERAHLAVMGGTLREGLQAIRGSHVLIVLLTIAFFAGAASEGFDRLWEAHLIRDVRFPTIGGGTPVVWFGVISLAGGVVNAVTVSVFQRRLNRAAGNQAATARALTALYALRLGSVVAVGLAGSFALAVVALMTKQIAGTLAAPLNETWLIQNIPSHVRATVLSVTSQADAIGQVAGGPGIGLIGNAISIRAAIVASAVLLSPALPLFGRALRRGEPVLTEAISAEAG